MSREGRRRKNVLRLVRHEPDIEIVHSLEGLLEDAKSARLRGILAAGYYLNGDVAYVGAGSFCRDPGAGLMALYGLAGRLLS